MVENVSAKILFGRDFSSDIFWSGFFFKHFSVGMSLQKKSGRSCLFRKKWWRMSLQRFCLVEISLLIFFGRDFSSNLFSVGMSLQTNSGRECLFRKNGGECLCKDFVW